MHAYRSAGFLALLACAAMHPAHAIDPVPEATGWRGFVVLGVGYVDLDSNLAAGNGLIDVGRDTVPSIASGPQNDDTWYPAVTGEVNYTFANQWQVFLGTSLEDAITLDAAAQLGVRKELARLGTLQAGLLFSGVPTTVWEDPYAEGVPRDDTDRDSTGLRLQWDRIGGTPFEATVSWRSIEVDTERSGQGVLSVDCAVDCQQQLRRDGDQYMFDVSYLFRPGDGRQHLLRPMLRYTIDDRDGAAIEGDGYRLQLSYVFLGDGFHLASNVTYGQRDFDAPNPLFGKRTDSDRVGADATLFYRLPLASGRWQAVGSVFWGEEDSDVDFHDSEAMTFNLGVMYRFGAARAAPPPESYPVD